MRSRLLLLAVTAALVLGALPSGAVPVPVIASDNIELLATFPDLTALSTAFAQDKPFMYVNSVNGISVYNIANPALPVLTGFQPLAHFENEAMSVGERPDGTTFVLVGIDIYAVAPTSTKPTHVTGGSAHQLYVVDVTNPAAPRIRGTVDTLSSSHTIQCIGKDCRYAYTSGAYNGGTWHIIDLANLDAPTVTVAPMKNVAGAGHQWDLDAAGYVWSTGFDGAAGYDVTDPLNPKAVASTDSNGNKGPYNDFVLHNSFRPGADNFTQTRDEATGRLVSGSKETANPADGNVLLVTEEDYDNPVCGGGAGEGTFSTWYLPYTEAEQYAGDYAAGGNGNRGKMTPLDRWNTEILNSGQPTVAGALCSAHYFTYHEASGLVAQGWYQQGTRILDVRNPRDIKQIGYFFTGDTETWHAYWVPEYVNGKQTGNDTNLIYTNDVARGIDVLKVTLPTTTPEESIPVTAPILPQWLALAPVQASAPSPKFGYACRIA